MADTFTGSARITIDSIELGREFGVEVGDHPFFPTERCAVEEAKLREFAQPCKAYLTQRNYAGEFRRLREIPEHQNLEIRQGNRILRVHNGHAFYKDLTPVPPPRNVLKSSRPTKPF